MPIAKEAPSGIFYEPRVATLALDHHHFVLQYDILIFPNSFKVQYPYLDSRLGRAKNQPIRHRGMHHSRGALHSTRSTCSTILLRNDRAERDAPQGRMRQVNPNHRTDQSAQTRYTG